MKTKRSANAVMAALFQRHLIDEATCEAKRIELIAHHVAFRDGEATDASFDELTTAAFRTRNGDFPEAHDTIGAAQTAIQSILDRANRLKRWGASGDELRALDEFISVYITMMSASTHLEMQQAARAAFPQPTITKRKRKAA